VETLCAAGRAARHLAVVLAVAALTVAACGGGGQQSGGGGGQSASQQPPANTVSVTLKEFSITPSGVTAKAGQAIFVQNKGVAPHDLAIADSNQKTVTKTDLIQPGATAQLALGSVPAGSYTLFCDVPGHRGQGMVGTLTVQ
jgi:plastocyanin